MSNLDTLMQKLKHKPEVHPNEGVRVVLDKPKTKTTLIITAEKDNGKRAQDILEKIKQHKLTAVIKKLPEEPAIAPILSLPPSLPPSSLKKPKKLKTDILLEEDKEKIPKEFPEGGPRLNEDPLREELKEEDVLVDALKPHKRTTKKIDKNIIELGPELMIDIGDTPLEKRLPPLPVFDVKVSSYYMNNREIFVQFINSLFEPYKEDLLDESKGISCEDIGKDTGEVSLLTHQKIVRDYINLYTPYRGLLLYHGLGSGKTCSSIAIAEGMKSARKIIIMTPASLRRNYMEEIKKCGDLLFRKNQYWEWISIEDNPNYIDSLSGALGLSKEYIRRNRGAWLVNIRKSSNYKDLTATDKKRLNDQLDEMIRNKYTFINYNGLRRERFKQLTNHFENNIFDNAVVIIDEAHNLISRIVNKINSIAKFAEKKRGPGSILPQSLALLLYEFLLNADNCRVILLTGTPIINYPNEIGILFNILRGYIKTWSFVLNTETNKKLSKDILQEIFNREKILDYMDYLPSSKTLTITRNPYGFENKISALSVYKGVTNEKKEKRNARGQIERDDMGRIMYDERGQISDVQFIQRIVKVLKANDIIAVPNGTTYTVNTALPDTLEEFMNVFINKETGNISNVDKFKRRIIGLTSYFRSAQEELLPSYDRHFDRHEVKIPMSDYQFHIYENYRQEERKMEKPNKKSSGGINVDGLFKEPSSTYRIFSRLACNFVMPSPPGRPTPSQYRITAKDGEGEEEGEKDIYKADAKVTKRQEVKEVTKRQEEEDEEEEMVKADAKADAKMQKEEAKMQKEDAKRQKEEAKREKEEAKRQKEEAKAEAKRQKEEAKAEAKRQKEEAKREKEEAKARKKAEKQLRGGEKDEDDEKDEEEEENDENEEDKEEDDEKKDEEEEDEDDKEEKKWVGGSTIEDFVDKNAEEIMPLENYKDEDAILREVDELEGDEILENMGNVEYKEAIKSSMQYLKLHSREYLSPEGLKIYSPKFLAMLDNINDPEHRGLHLIYSQFRSMEGIGIFSLTLEANGYAKFKIKRTGTDGWELNMSEEDMGKPCYALYTGTEDAEEREIIRNIYNGMWDYIPNNIATQLRTKSLNNNLGEIIKILMITSAGSEGINLRNTRYVHIMEPYWHPVRIEQVIGRARRICSHQSLPKELQTVEVFIYIMTFTQSQLDSDFAIELKLKDLSKNRPYLPQTSDQKLFEISTIKEQLTSQLLKAVKETSIDCATHSKSSSKEGLACLSFGQPSVNSFSYNPNYTQDENDTVAALNIERVDWEARPITIKTTGKRYMLRVDTNQIYDYDSVIQARQIPGVKPILIGKFVKNARGEYEIVKERF
jgi:hypothetical protein